MAAILHLLLPCLAVAAAIVLGGCGSHSPSLGPAAVTPHGSVRGFVLNGMKVWRGIRYAAPPLKDLRFRPPQPPTPWNVTLDTVDFGAMCTQWGSPTTDASPAWESLNLTDSSEDCLFVNVYVPDGATTLLPVMVYLHAGEFRFGGSNDLESKWPYFVDGSAILVTANVRLGLLGFAALDVLRSRDPSGSSGNYGVQDQRAVLQWVQESIAAFGGNASRVTMFGESSGGSSVAFHLTSKASQGLFSQAILESPGLTQSKSWTDSSQNTEAAVSALTAAGSPGCTWPSKIRWMHIAGLGAFGAKPLANASKSEAHKVCAMRPDCYMVYTTNFSNHSVLYGGGSPGKLNSSLASFFNLTMQIGHNPGLEVSIRMPNPNTSVQCLVSASVLDLVALNAFPIHDDTFLTDSVAPTVDGVELTAPLEHVAMNAVPEDVAVLAGSNLDEGTEFMYVVPPIACNATEEQLLAWSKQNFGPELGSKVPQMYETVEQPTPLCMPPFKPNFAGQQMNTSKYWVAAMRSAGDSAILCRTRELLRQVQTRGSRAWWYYFTHTPIYSMNMRELKYYGAFHGAEVPFVFGAQFELKSEEERGLSRAMGCYWINFAATGNPNEGPSGCASKLSLPKWPTLGEGDAIELTVGTLHKKTKLKQAECDMFAAYHEPKVPGFSSKEIPEVFRV